MEGRARARRGQRAQGLQFPRAERLAARRRVALVQRRDQAVTARQFPQFASAAINQHDTLRPLPESTRPTLGAGTDIPPGAPPGELSAARPTVRNGIDLPTTAPASGLVLSQIDFVIVLVRTTGWSPDDARSTEVGAVSI